MLESLSCHDLKYLDISDCNNVTSVQVAKLLARQPNVEELSLQSTCHMAAILNVLASNRQSLENLKYTIEFICSYHSDWTGVEIFDDKQSVKAKNRRETKSKKIRNSRRWPLRSLWTI